MQLETSDILYMYLADSSFVDLIEILSPEQLKQFILIFGGTTIAIPSIADIKNCNRDYRIYNYVEIQRTKRGAKSLKDIYNEASKVFHCSETIIYKIYNNIRDYYKRLEEQKAKID